MPTAIGIVGGSVLHYDSKTDTVSVEPPFCVPLRKGKIIATSDYTDIPEILILGPDGSLLIYDVMTDGAFRIEIRNAKDHLAGVTVRCAAMCPQMVAVATDTSVIVFSHSDSAQQPPTVLQSARHAVTYVGFTANRRRLITGHVTGRVCCIDIHVGLLTPVDGTMRELVPASAAPKACDAVVAANILSETETLVLCNDHLQLWKSGIEKTDPLVVKKPSGCGSMLKMTFYRGRVFVLCEHAVWTVCERKKGQKADVKKANGNLGWCIDLNGIVYWNVHQLSLRRIK